jgi:hypothetical protein
MKHGTSGDIVFDILKDWKEELSYLTQDIATTEEWIDTLHEKNRNATFYEGYRAGLVDVMNKLLGMEHDNP